MANFDLDPSVLPHMRETKGSILLRCDHALYKRGVLTTGWHQDREALPMDYDVTTCEEKDRDLSKAAYSRLGNATDGSMKDNRTTQQDVLEEVGKLKPDYETQEIHKSMVTYGNFSEFSLDRDTGRPARDYGSVLPRHPPGHRKAYMITTHSVDFKYPYEWTPKNVADASEEPVHFHRPLSEFADNDGPKRLGTNTFRDCSGSVS